MRKFLPVFMGMLLTAIPANVFAVDEATSIEELLKASGGEVTVDINDAGAVINSGTTNNAKPKTLDIGKTGLPLPRFVSLKRDKVNVRKGPSETFGIAWQYTRKNLPVEIIAEYDNWRKVRDHTGDEGWVFHSLLSGSRYAMVSPWKTEGYFTLHNERRENSKVVAKVQSGSMARIQACDGTWCQMNVETYQGHIKQEYLWGIYLGDSLK